MQLLVSIVVACHGEARELPVLLGSLLTQRRYTVGRDSRDPRVQVHRVCSGGYQDAPLEIVATSDGPFQGDYRCFDDSRVKLIECPAGIGGPTGHGTRDYGIAAASGEWLLLTNADNYVVAGWLDRIVPELRPDVGMVYWDCVSNLWQWGTLGGCRFERGGIDLACAVVRTTIAKEAGFPGREYDSDWDYLSRCAMLAMQARLRLIHIEEVLSVHN